MTTSMQAIELEPGGQGTARPAGLRATALRRLRRDQVALVRVQPARSCWCSPP